MKKITAILMGTLMATSAVFAQSNVLSRNAVGYIKIPVGPTGSLHLVSNPFVPLDASGDLLTNMFAAIANSSQVAIWDEGSQSYKTYGKSNRGSWLGSGFATVRVARADGVFIRSAATSTVYFMGEVPDRFTAPTTTQSRATGITMLGNPYPVEEKLTNTAMGLALPAFGQISLWNPATTSYTTYGKSSRGSWIGTITNTIKPGEAVVIRSTNTPANWAQGKPYTWP